MSLRFHPVVLGLIFGICLILPAESYGVTGWVNDGLGADEDWTNSTTELSANWSAVANAFGYWYAIGTKPGTTDVVPWTPAPGQGSQNYVTHTGLNLSHGMTCYFTVEAEVAIGRIRIGSSDGITVDTNAPASQVNPLPSIQRNAVFEVSWGGSDDLSGVASYDVQFRDGEGKWENWRTGVTYTSDIFTGQYGHTYYFRSRATDNAGNVEGYPTAPDAQTTIVKPTIEWVRDGLGEDEAWTRSTTELSANWSSAEGVYGYEYSIWTTPGSKYIVDWRPSGNQGSNTWVTHRGLSLTNGVTYYFGVRGVLHDGYTDPRYSDGITVDSIPPTSSVLPLPPQQVSTTFTVSWSGNDNASGIKNYDVQYKDGAGSWQNWLVATTATSAIFSGEVGHTYYFRCRALDNAGNQEEFPPDADTYTTIVSGRVAWVNDGLGDDKDWTNSTDTLSANWASVEGAYAYQYAIGTSPYGTDIVNWTLSPSQGSQTFVTRSGLTLTHGTKYYFSVRVVWDPKGSAYSDPTSSDGITVDTNAPTSQVNALPSEVDTTSFEVSWGGSDDLSGIASYDVQYRDGSGSWVDWRVGTSATSSQFTGVAGHTYYFRSRATDNAGNVEEYPSAPDAQTTVRQVTPPPPPPPPPPPTELTLTITSSPTALVFHSGESTKNVRYTISLTGPRGVTINQEQVVFEQEGRTLSTQSPIISQSISAGGTISLDRTITIDDALRSLILSGRPTATCTVRRTFSGQDERSNPVSCEATINVEVRTTPPETFSVTSIDLVVPSGPFVEDEDVQGKVRFAASGGPGRVEGNIYIDGRGWRSFIVDDIADGDEIDTPPLPTSAVGTHTIRVELTAPNSLEDSTSYEVAAGESLGVFERLRTLNVLKDGDVPWAVLSEISATATRIEGGSGTEHERYRLNGTGSLRINSLDNRSVDVNINDLLIEFNSNDPPNSRIISGSLETSPVVPPAYLFTVYYDFLAVTRVRYEGGWDHLTIDANLKLPIIDQNLYNLSAITVRSGGIEGKSFNDPHSFNLCGLEFRLETVTIGSRTHPPIELGFAGGSIFATLSGNIDILRAGRSERVTSFTGFRFAVNVRNGAVDVSGDFSLRDPFRFIPGNDYFNLTRLTFRVEGSNFGIEAQADVNLPSPFDRFGRQQATFRFDRNGDVTTTITAIDEPSSERRTTPEPTSGSGSDPTQVPFWVCQLDLTYLGIDLAFRSGNLNKALSKVKVGADLWVRERDDRWLRQELGTSRFPCFIIDFDGNTSWSVPTEISILRDRKIDLGAVWIDIRRIDIVPTPFALVLSAGLGIDVDVVSSSVAVDGFRVDLDGNINWGTLREGEFEVLDVVRIAVESIEFSTTPTTITFETDASEGSNHRTREESISVNQYVRITNAELNLQASSAAFSGSFDTLLIYERTTGQTRFAIKGVDLNICGFQLLAGFDYRNPVIAVAGSIEGAGFPIRIAGKLGSVDGDLTFGLFATIGIPPTTIVPPAFLVLAEIGGGFFYNPEQRDIDEIRSLCGVDHSELSRKAGSGNIPPDLPVPDPGRFAVLLYGGFYCLNDNLVKGQALITLSNNYLMFDAHAEVFPAEGPIATGALHLCISWSPAFAEGGVWVDVDIIDIVTGTGYFEFYIFPRRDEVVWAIMGGANLEVISIIDIESEFFIGPPGFMISGRIEVSIDLFIISGGFSLEMMVWYETIEPGETWGAYAKGEVWGDFLAGLFSASATLEGALIFDPLPEVIAGATLRISAIWCLVKWSGSIWIAIGAYGIDGGTGRNSKLDQALEDARSMAETMSEEMEEIKDAIDSVAAAIGTLDPRTREILGAQLVGLESNLILPAFYHNESSLVRTYRRPDICTWILNNVLSDSRLQDLWRIRAERNRAFDGYKSLTATIGPVQEAVQRKLDEALPQLEALPTVAEISLRNPVRGMQYETVGDRRLKVGFDLDQAAADQGSRAMSENKQSQQEYIRSVIAQTENLSRLVAKTDELLYGSSFLVESRGGSGRFGRIGTRIILPGTQPTLMNLANMYASCLDSLNKYYIKYFEFLDRAYTTSVDKYRELSPREEEVRSAIEAQVEALRIVRATNDIKQLTRNRRSMLQSLYNVAVERMREEGVDPATLPPEEQPQPPIAIDESWTEDQWQTACINFGMELWYHIPIAGYMKAASSISLLPVRRDLYQRNVGLINAWADFTTRLDLVFERRVRLYELLYDLYDELSTVYGAYPLPVREDTVDVSSLRLIEFKEVIYQNPAYVVGGSGSGTSSGGSGGSGGPLGMGGGGLPLGTEISRTRQTEISGSQVQRYLRPEATLPAGVRLPTCGSYYGSEKRKVFDLLLPPELTLFAGECRGIDSRAGSYARFDCRFDASHRKGVVEYGIKVWQPDHTTDLEGELGVISSDWLSLGDRKKDFTMLFVPDATPPGEGRRVFIRARGPAGNYTYRRGTVQVSYSATTTLDTSDPTPPTTPVVDDYPLIPEGTAAPHAGEWTRDRTSLYARWKSQDNESGINEYQYRVVTHTKTSVGGRTVMVPVAVKDWTSAGAMEELNIRDLPLQNNSTYYVEVKARNGAGAWSMVGSSDGIRTDFEPPRITAVSLRQASAEMGGSGGGSGGGFGGSGGGFGGSGGAFGGSPPIGLGIDPSRIPSTAIRYYPNSLFAEFSCYDGESGVEGYQFSVMDESGREIRSGYTVLNRLSLQDLPLRGGGTYRISVSAKDNVGWVSEPRIATATVRFTDTTPPPAVSFRYLPPTSLPPSCTYINARLYIYSTDRINLQWDDVYDGESGILEYRVSVGTARDRADVLPATSIGKVNQYENRDLRLENGRSYFITVKAVNGAGLESAASIGPLKVETTPPTQPSVQFLGGVRVRFTSRDDESPVKLYRFATYDQRGMRRYDSGWLLVPSPSNNVTVEFDVYSDDMRARHVPQPETGWTVAVITRNEAGWQSDEGRVVLGSGFEIPRPRVSPPRR